VPALKGRKPNGDVVAWARQREDGGRGFGTTCGHFYDNWKHPEFRKMILNAIAWTAKVEVPKEGVESKFYTHKEIRKALEERGSIRVLMFAGNEAHRWHNWEKTTPRIKKALELDARIRVEVSTDIEDLARKDLGKYQVIVLNSYCNWHDPKGLSAKAKTSFVKFLKDGGGLVLVHFANGAFHFSLPKAAEANWPEYRKIVRRVWNHTPKKGKQPSGHDAFGRFLVLPTKTKHPITEGLTRFEVVDELYFRQDGEEPIVPLIEGESKVTKKLEPLAWTYTYGKGKVFQTLLGHSEKTYDAFETREMLRRAVAWTAGRPVRPLDAKTDTGK
jgi:type 1 glutamine amidotransferase